MIIFKSASFEHVSNDCFFLYWNWFIFILKNNNYAQFKTEGKKWKVNILVEEKMTNCLSGKFGLKTKAAIFKFSRANHVWNYAQEGCAMQ